MITKTQQGGFTLIEILISIVVLSVGILGVAAMQTLGVRYTQNSFMLSVATQQAEDIVERMRANPAEMVNTATGYYSNNMGTAFTGTEPDCVTSTCTTVQRAQFDHSQWNTANNTLFGSPGTVTFQADGTFLVTIIWTDVESDTSTGRSYTLSFLP